MDDNTSDTGDAAAQYLAELHRMPRQALIAHAIYNGEFASALVTQVSTRATQLAMLAPTDEPIEQAFRAGMTQMLSWMGDAISERAGQNQPAAQDASSHLYVDMDSGTVLNGPIYAVPAYLLTSEVSDGEVIGLAERYGEPATPVNPTDLVGDNND